MCIGCFRRFDVSVFIVRDVFNDELGDFFSLNDVVARCDVDLRKRMYRDYAFCGIPLIFYDVFYGWGFGVRAYFMRRRVLRARELRLYFLY